MKFTLLAPRASRVTLHEDYARAHPRIHHSDRAFGLSIAAALAVLAAIQTWRGLARGWTIGVAIVVVTLVLLALAAPRLLRPLHVVWRIATAAIGRLATEFVVMLMFVIAIVPPALVRRLGRHDSLRRAIKRDAATYWQRREDSPTPDSAHRQF
jgi:hypothetical protein